MVKKKPSMGRQKIKIEKIPKKNHLQVTFSKRRAGLFKKASELCTLCGLDIAVIVFSPAQKAFSFGHPNVESIMERYFTRNPPANSGTQQLIEAHRNANVREHNMQLTQILNELEAEKKYGEELGQIRKDNRSLCWWESPIEELKLYELEQLRDALTELKKRVAKQANKILIESANSLPFYGENGIGQVGNFETKLEVNTSSTISHFNNFGHGYGIF